MGQIDLGKVRGTQIYTGTAITGSDAIGIIFPGSGIAKAYAGDLYINTDLNSADKGNLYDCVLSGNASTAKWSYRGNVRGPKVDVVNNLESTSTEEALTAYQGKRLYDMLISAGVFSKNCIVECGETAYGVKITIDNVSTKLTFVVNGSEYTYSYNQSGTAEKTTLSISIGGSIGMSVTGGVLTEIRSSNAYIYAFDITNGSSASIYSKNMELWDTLNEALQTHEITGEITDGTETIKTGFIYKFLKGIKTLFYPVTHAKAVWYKKSSNITVYDQIESNTNALSGKAPTSHATSATSYGKGTSSYYGHVKLSDSTSSTSAAASGGMAATPKAVKAAYDKATEASTTAGTKLPLAGGTMEGQITFSADATGNGMICMLNAETPLEVMRAITGDEPTLLINDGMYEEGVGNLNLSAGKMVRLLIQNERIIFEESSDATYSAHFRPKNDNKCTLGTAAQRFYGLWAGKSTVQTSDAREKENVIPLGTNPIMMLSLDETQPDIHSEIFDRLRPVQYNFIDGDGRICYGLIAQEVAASLEELGIGEHELDLVHHEFYKDDETKEEKESYGLAYNNLIALLIHEVQKLKAEIATLKQ